MKSIVVEPKSDQFEKCRQFLTERLSASGVPGGILDENIMVFEELYSLIIRENIKNKALSVGVVRNYKGVTIRVSFEGKRFYAGYDPDTGELDPTLSLLSEYREKISYKYATGTNEISISVVNRYNSNIILALAHLIIAIPAFALLDNCCGDAALSKLNSLFMLFVRMFINAVIMFSAPVTFFSLITNISDGVHQLDSSHNMTRVLRKIVSTSVFAIVLAYLLDILFKSYMTSYVANHYAFEAADSFIGNLTGSYKKIVYSDIFSAFTVYSPFPLILIAVLNAAALCSMTDHYDTMKAFTDSANDLMTRLSSIVFLVLPLMAFLSMFGFLYKFGYSVLLDIVILSLFVLGACVLLMLTYFARLAFNGINPFRFFAKCLPAIGATVNIGSSIDALPYNIRYMSRTFSIDRNLLKKEMPLMSQMNLDGNCLVLFLIAMGLINAAGIEMPFANLVLLAVLVLAISAGAPNQGGFILIGMVIIASYLNLVEDNICGFVIYEVLWSSFITVLNTFGDFTIAAIDAKKQGTFDIEKQPVA